MSDTPEKLRQELEAAQRALAEAQARCERHDAEHRAATKELEDNRSALLYMLEDLDSARKNIESAHQEWMAALDAVEDPIFLHDKQFRILRCNKAYQQCAGIHFKQIIGQPYYEVFPKTGAPLSCCLSAMEKAEEEEEEEVAAGAAIYRSRAFSIKDEQGAYLYSVHTLEDITESRRAEAALHESEGKFRKITESAQDAIIMMGADQRISFWNIAAEQIFGYTAAEAMGQELHPLITPPTAQAAFARAFPHFQASGEGPNIGKLIEVTALRKNGQEFPVELSISATQLNEQWHAIAIVHDITERKQAEANLKLFRALLDNSIDSIEVVDPTTLRFLDMNETGCRDLGYSREEILSMSIPDIDVSFSADSNKMIEAQLRQSGQARFEAVHRRKDGSTFPVEVSAKSIKLDKPYVLSIVRDITERKRAEAQLKNSEERHHQIVQTSMDGFWITDTKGRILDVNDAYCQLTGYTPDELLNMRIADVEAKETQEQTAQHIQEIMTKGHARFETRHRRKDGQLLDIEVSFVHAPNKEDGYLFVFLRDITERKRAESAIQHANRALGALSAVNRTLVRSANEEELLQSICQDIVTQRGYRLAWVGYVQYDKNKSIKIMAYASDGGGYPDTMQPTWAEEEHGMGPSGRAVRSGTTQLCQDIANDPHYSPWRDEALQRGYAASIALPLLNGENKVFGTLTVYAEEVNAFTHTEIELLEEMAGDMAFGVRTLHIRHERDLVLVKNQEQLAQLQDSLEDTVKAIATIVEMRDPYTAGHQVRVADLAVAIAKQMGLPDEQIHAIHLAGIVHDLGKINIPAEILSKPGKITDIEYSLIKIHPQAGYDILKGIDFPWPIAQMVLQHHERLDGSGYPQGLKGEQIIIEARILSVADVVEAMSSHRPYRPGLGIDSAIEEICRRRGTHYDTQVVDACLVLFREQDYSFK